MKIHRKTSPKRPIKKDALRFSPNFSVYLLPDDIVCLYSEDRKYFLHGSLYCALASEIAKGKKSGRDLVVRVVDRSADLTVTLANDYLEPRLAELNRQRVADKAPWLLVQPSGVFPLVGPVLKPGESACWTCLFDRMVRNREIRGFLDRGGAQRVAASPLVRNTLGQGAIQFAAIEI